MNPETYDSIDVQPLVILGAARSGTNILRDVLTSFPELGTWPCDEINYIWRHGNARAPTDELTPGMARPSVMRYIRREFEREAARQRVRHLVEKTCANTLRVRFVDRVLPEARYVYIVRDGIDVVASARERWTSSLDLRYTLRKIRYAPISDAPLYAWVQISNRLKRIMSGTTRLSTWGPRFEGIDRAAASLSTEELCALQWVKCVEAAERDLESIPPERVHRLRYEDFARDTEQELMRLSEFVGVFPGRAAMEKASSEVSSRSIGRGRDALGERVMERVLPIMKEALASRSYSPEGF